MLNRIKILSLTILALAALLLAACGGDGGDAAGNDTTSNVDEGKVNDDLFVSAGAEVLSNSAERFAAEIESMQGEMDFAITTDGETVDAHADFAFQSPDGMHMLMTMNIPQDSGVDLGELDFEIIARDGTMYMTMPLFGGWMSMDLDDLGVDAEGLQDMLESGSPFDYQQLVDAFGEVKFVGEETLDGRVVVHYSVSADMANVLDSFAESLEGSGAELGEAGDISGPMTLDIWVGKDDYLPYQMTMDAAVDTADGAFAMELTISVSGYNDPVDIPDAPADALPFDEFFEDLGESFEDGLDLRVGTPEPD
ncbi:MAG: DUF6612 family protein [Dehalococcoidia bacterium]